MNFVNAVEDFFVNKALGRAIAVVAQAVASYALAHSGVLQSYGVAVTVDPNVLSAGLLGFSHVAAQWLGAKLAPHFPGLAHVLGANVVPVAAAPAVPSAPQGN